MDGHRFDSMARELAGSTSRRTLLRYLVGGAAAAILAAAWPRPATAQDGDGQAAGASGVDQGLNQTGWGFAPGQACVTDFQCDNAYPELGIAYCADTGYVYGAYGGERHCCRYEGGSCGGPLSDDHSLCCDGLLCLGGVCGWG